MKFSVIIPTYNDCERLMKCLRTLERQSVNSEQYEVIVVDNSKVGNIPSRISFSNGIQLVHEPRAGSYRARNAGARQAEGDILAFTDSDCIPQHDWLENAASCLRNTNCDLIGGEIKMFQDDSNNKCGYLYERIKAFPQHLTVPRGRGVTANLIVKKEVFETMNGFLGSIKSGGDWEFTLRCIDNGYSLVYDENTAVWHPARTMKEIFKKQKRLVYGGAMNAKKKYGHSYLRMLASHIKYGPKFGRRKILPKLSYGQRGIIYGIDALKYVYRILLCSAIVCHLSDPDKVR